MNMVDVQTQLGTMSAVFNSIVNVPRWITPRGPFLLISGPCSLESPEQILATGPHKG